MEPSAGAGAANGAAGMAGATPSMYGFGATVQPLFNQACNCHQSTPVLMAPFSLKPGEAYGNLVGAASTQITTMPRVTAGKLNDSYLWHKVKGTHLEVGGMGMIMPYTVPLNEQELDVVAQWIAAGAPP